MAPLPGIRPYVLSLVHAGAAAFEIRGPKVPQGGQRGLRAAARRFVAPLFLRLGRIFDAQTLAPPHRHHLGNILTRAHNLGGSLWQVLFPSHPIAAGRLWSFKKT